jgi:hypothetical protein
VFGAVLDKIRRLVASSGPEYAETNQLYRPWRRDRPDLPWVLLRSVGSALCEQNPSWYPVTRAEENTDIFMKVSKQFYGTSHKFALLDNFDSPFENLAHSQCRAKGSAFDRRIEDLSQPRSNSTTRELRVLFEGSLKNPIHGTFQHAKRKLRFPLRFIFKRLSARKWRGIRAPHGHLVFF